MAAALAYQWDSQLGGTADFETFGGSVSLAHVPTGLYVAFQAAEKEYKGANALTSNFWYAQAGIEKKLLPYGATTVYGEYGKYNDVSFKNQEATRFGLGLNQKIDSAAMDIYAHATFWNFDDNRVGGRTDIQDMSTVLVGSRIQF